ncbi:hypothetical protein [Azospirillum sp.]|uniref:hypothetical protein n=1 Tax=Azospirillum sp. TaxID=34012 RepID=UPI003D747C8F
MTTITYTMADVDAALREIIGDKVYDAMRECSGWSRTRAMDQAAVRCFLDQREDRHTRVLRAALAHLNRTGVIMPDSKGE